MLYVSLREDDTDSQTLPLVLSMQLEEFVEASVGSRVVALVVIVVLVVEELEEEADVMLLSLLVEK